MMEYNPAYVHFEPVNGMIGKWCLAADSIYRIKEMLALDNDCIKRHLIQIENTEHDSGFPFRIVNDNPDEKEETCWKFVYIDPAFQSMMREIYVGIDPQIGLTYSINSNKFKHVYYTTSSIEDAKEWVARRRKFEAVMGAWEDGAVIQKRISDAWDDVDVPTWDPDVDYRIKPDTKVLEWTKLKLGDVIQRVSVGQIAMVTAIDSFDATYNHIFAGGWIADKDLKDWEKVDE